MLTAILTRYPDAKRTKRYKDDDDYYFKALGRSIGGAEVMSYAAEVLDKFPKDDEKRPTVRQPVKKPYGKPFTSRIGNFLAGRRRLIGLWARILPWSISVSAETETGRAALPGCRHR